MYNLISNYISVKTLLRNINYCNFFLSISDIECPPFNITDIPESRLSHGYKIGTQANFTCPRGFELIGKPKLTCLSNGMYAIVYLYYSLRRYYTLIQKWLTKINVLFLGKWSAGPPRCSPIRCVALEILDAHLRVLALNNTYRGLATFLCPFGYRLVGPDSIKCGHEGRWTGSVPSCKGMFIKSSMIILLSNVLRCILCNSFWFDFHCYRKFKWL